MTSETSVANFGRLRQVTACQRHVVQLRQPEEAVEKAIHPAWTAASFPRQLRGHREREKCGEGASTHRRQITQAARQAAMPDRLGRVPLAAEMHLLKREVGGYDDIFVGPGSQDGAVVANAHAELAPRRTCARSNRRDKA